VAGDGIDALYQRLDPYDVCPAFTALLLYETSRYYIVPRAGGSIQVMVHVFPQSKFSMKSLPRILMRAIATTILDRQGTLQVAAVFDLSD
jgi:hypothetical protein